MAAAFRWGPFMRSTSPQVKCLFLDIGGVLLTNGWDRHARSRASTNFQIDHMEMEDRHHLTVDTYEEGRLSLADYLDRVIFYKDRPFTPSQFRDFMFSQSRSYPEMIALVGKLKARYDLKTAVVSNEGRELNAHRIREFKLERIIDFFVCSCFVHIRKPDAGMFHLALDFAQVEPHEILYLENTPMFVDIAEALGIRSILHTDYTSTCARLADFGLQRGDEVVADKGSR